ncbi:MAG TPA: hypothetical protein VKR22_02075 [Acidimicrobiales bacterium]|nr:hypothetical protein [Acidimicrobiales bacterium]
MMALGITVCVIVAVLVVTGWFLLGFRLGGIHWQNRLVQTQMETANARRQLHDLTREAFVAMADHAQRHLHRS